MTQREQTGFALIETILILVILVMIGGVGYYVWHAKQSTEATLQQNNAHAGLQTKSSAPKIAQDPAIASWLEYKAPSGHFSVHLADGWDLNRCKGSDFLYTYGSEHTQYKPGAKARVADIDCGSDGSAVGLFISYYAKTVDSSGKVQGEKTGTFKTAQGVEVTAYLYTKTTEEDALGDVPKGGKIYSYVAKKSDAILVYVYGIGPTDPDSHAVVEQSVKSFVFN
jgi:Tfp pilus assembly protein PilV